MKAATLPAQNLDAEESVLGAILTSKNAIDAASVTGLRPDDFYRNMKHGRIYAAALAMHEAGEPVDAITVCNELARLQILDKVGGQTAIYELAASVRSTSNVGHYAEIVKEMAGLRSLADAGREIGRLAQERPGTLPELLVSAEAALGGVVTKTFSGSFTPFAEGIDSLIADTEEAYKTGTPKLGHPSGFHDLDSHLTGFHPGQLIVVAARPGMGKSTLMQNMMENLADAEVPAAILTLEMSKEEVWLKAISREAKICSKLIRSGKLKDDLIERFRKAVPIVKARSSHLFLSANASMSTVQLRAEITRLHRQHGVQVVGVDYLQLMVSGLPDLQRTQEVTAITRALKVLAKDLGITIIALSQLNRNLEARENKRPVLSDLRESGSIEQDADVVMFIYRDEYYNDQSTEAGVAEIIIEKCRMGERGKVKLTFSGRRSSFMSMARDIQ